MPTIGESHRRLQRSHRTVRTVLLRADLHRNLGVVYVLAGKPDLGRQELDVALKLRPNDLIRAGPRFTPWRQSKPR
jgi:hypothetical protein